MEWKEQTEEVKAKFKDYIKRLLLHCDEVQCEECTTAPVTTDANNFNINDGYDKQQNTIINECSGSNNTNTGTIVEQQTEIMAQATLDRDLDEEVRIDNVSKSAMENNGVEKILEI